jgi:hypothetical protein
MNIGFLLLTFLIAISAECVPLNSAGALALEVRWRKSLWVS